MKKILLSFFAFLLMAVTAFAQGTVFSWSAAGDWTTLTDENEKTVGVSLEQSPYTVVLLKESGLNAATVNANANDARVYAKGTATVSTTGENMTSLVFAISAQGKRRLPEITPNTGEVTVDTENWTVTWTGDAQSVVLTVGEKAVYGTDGATKAGQFNFDNITIYTNGEGGGEEGGGETPVEPEVPGVLWSESFGSSIGTFTIEDKSKDEALRYVWSFASGYGMKACGYAHKTNYAAESWLVSPVLDLTNATNCSISFQQAGNYFSSTENMQAAVSVKAKVVGDEVWKDLEVTPWPEGTSFTFIPSTASLQAFEGNKIQLAFVYTSTSEVAGTWEVKDLQVLGKGSAVVPEPEVPNYTSVADLVAAATAATADKVDVTYEFANLLVTGVGVRGSNTSVYVSDGKALQLYGAATTFKKGDKISGKLAGQLCVYNNVTELVVTSYEGVTVSSSDNAVEPAVVTIADVNNDETYLYQNQYVQLQGVYFAADTLAISNITMIDDSDNEMVLRDNFNVLGDVIFNTSKTYNVSGYVAYFKGVAQLYACEASDVQMITNLKDAETAWAAEEVVVLPSDEQKVDNALTTLSDGEKTFTSSNPDVATVDAEGNITLTGKGVTVISVETAETDNYLESKASFTLFVIEGEGTFEAPYTPADVQYFNGKAEGKVWVKGQILGSINGSAIYPASDTEKTVASNIAIGTPDLYVPVQLVSKSDVRAALNLIDHPELQDATVWVYGNLENYFSMPGVKNTSDFSLEGQTGIIAIEQPATGEKHIYSIDGRRLTKLTKGINIVNGKKVLY